MVQSCNHCKAQKPLSEFHKNKNKKNGHSPECKACANLRSKLRYQREGEKLRRQMADQRKKDYEYRLEIERRSRAKNKDRYRPIKNATQSKRNRLINKKEYEILEKNLRRIYDSECWFCKTKENISLDYVIPLSRGGTHSAGNMLSLCRSCNSSKGNRLLSEWRYKKDRSWLK